MKYKIKETENAFRAVFFSEAKGTRPVEHKNFKLMVGNIGDMSVIKWIEYFKEYCTKEEALKRASKVETGDYEKQIKEEIEKKKQEIEELKKVYDRLMRENEEGRENEN